MPIRTTIRTLLLFALLPGLLFVACNNKRSEVRLLVFSKTKGFRHQSIPDGQQAFFKLAGENGWIVDTTENSEVFTDENLSRYSAVVFLNTTGDVLDNRQQASFERYIQAGGGYVGVHAATDTEYDWPWYNRLAGAYFTSHPNDPNVRKGTMRILDNTHPSTRFFGDRKIWERNDEFYNFRDIYHGKPDGIKPLIDIDEKSYEGGTNGDFHPMSWYHDYDGGRAFYTNFGHTSETYSEPDFLQHLKGGVEYAIGDNKKPDYTKAYSLLPPDPTRFLITVLDEGLNEPEELEVLRDGRILFTQRRGELNLHDPATGETRLVAKLDVHTGHEDGLVGLALDPKFYTNNWIYLYYSPAGDEPKFQLSRFTFKGDSLNMASEKVLLEVATQREQCCHTGGSIEFGPEGLLYLSTGDNTNPFETSYAPINETDGRSPWDAQKSSANPNDLRGKVLRIRPTEYGTYEIPDGNLFPKDGSQGRPEIYVMGCRNPYRISVDRRSGYLYWGDVGPDGQKDSTRGPRGYDELNQARQAGFFGWPYFIADNKPYRRVDYQTQTLGDWFDPVQPVNFSPNNTGIRNLPPAQPAFIWYPYAESKEFPIVGKGGRNAMAGPVYHYDDFKGAKSQFPKYYDGKLFIYDFMRDWVLLVTMDKEGNLEKIEHFLEDMGLSSPMDMAFGPDGALYILEYGTRWFAQNADARLIRIDYAEGNRAPVARMELSSNVGAAPLEVQFSAAKSIDYDKGDKLSYTWDFGNGRQAQGESASMTFDQAGIYPVTLTVRDPAGETGKITQELRVGNAPPRIELAFGGNRSFFWDEQAIPYRIEITDTEDGTLSSGQIAASAVSVSFDFLDGSRDRTQGEQNHAAIASASILAQGEELIKNTGCIACHGIQDKILGPAYIEVARKYARQNNAVDYLTGKIINGGSGIWGGNAMPAQQQVAKDDARKMAQYILSLAQAAKQPTSLPPTGTLRTGKHSAFGEGSSYTLRISYTDKGGEPVGALNAHESVILRSALMQAEEFDQTLSKNTQSFDMQGSTLLVFTDEGYAAYPRIDLSQLSKLTLRGASVGGGRIELRLDAPDGPLLAALDVKPATITGGGDPRAQFLPINEELSLAATEGFHTLYLVASKQGSNPGAQALFALDWFYFLPPAKPAS
ncbi:MAG: hypothetical protein OHK0039_25620 [Bacteroidia bacterium]